MKMGDYIYHTINDNGIYNHNDYNDYKIRSYVDKSETSLSDVKDFIGKTDKISDLNKILDCMDEDVIQIYLREKKIKRIKDNIQK